MKNYAVLVWEKIGDKLGDLAQFIVPVSHSLKISISSGDVEKIRGHSTELKQLGEKMIQISSFLDSAVADGNVDLFEGAEALKLFNELLDEGEDVLTGVDEDTEVE